jgi:hypothetical protein
VANPLRPPNCHVGRYRRRVHELCLNLGDALHQAAKTTRSEAMKTSCTAVILISWIGDGHRSNYPSPTHDLVGPHQYTHLTAQAQHYR